MAILDQRLIPLVEILADLGIDWLAFEMIDAVRRGHESKESEEALEMARRWRDSYDPEKFAPPFEDGIKGMAPYGENQVKWAARYIYGRVEASISHM